MNYMDGWIKLGIYLHVHHVFLSSHDQEGKEWKEKLGKTLIFYILLNVQFFIIDSNMKHIKDR